MLQKTIQRTLPGLVAALLTLPGGTWAQAAMERLSRVKHLDRAKLSESQWNVGLQGAGYDGNAAVGRSTNPMTYPTIWSGEHNTDFWRDAVYGNSRSMNHDCSKGEGVWVLARDAGGKVYYTSSGPRFVSPDVQIDQPSLAPGGNLKLRNGQDHPFAQARIGYDSNSANAWFNSDKSAPSRHTPLSEEPIEINNFRKNGQYTLPKFDHFPEEAIISRWKSNGKGQGTGLTMTRHACAWSHPDFDDFFIVEMTVENTSGRDYEEVYMGYLNYFSVSEPGHALQRWNGWFRFLDPDRGVEDDRFEYTEAPNYTGKYRGKVVSYQYDGDNPRSGFNDTANPAYSSILGRAFYAHLAEAEITSPQYVGWGPVDLTPPFVNDPETYVPITGTAAGGPDIPSAQPAYVRWFKARRGPPEFDPHPNLHSVEKMYSLLITPGQPVQPLPVDGGPTVEETYLNELLHSNMYGPWKLKQGEKAKIVVVFAAGMGSEYAGTNGEPMEDRYWRMTSNATTQVADGERALMNHIDRGRQLYRMGYDLPNQPPDAQSDARKETGRALLRSSSKNGHTVLTWTEWCTTAR